jgi:hypothetical protein
VPQFWILYGERQNCCRGPSLAEQSAGQAYQCPEEAPREHCGGLGIAIPEIAIQRVTEPSPSDAIASAPAQPAMPRASSHYIPLRNASKTHSSVSGELARNGGRYVGTPDLLALMWRFAARVGEQPVVGYAVAPGRLPGRRLGRRDHSGRSASFGRARRMHLWRQLFFLMETQMSRA